MKRKQIKKIFAASALALCVCTNTNSNIFAKSPVPDMPVEKIAGDTNGDGKVDVKDNAIIKRHLSGWKVDINLSAADVNNDTKVDIKDSALLKRHLSGWDVTLVYGNVSEESDTKEDNPDQTVPAESIKLSETNLTLVNGESTVITAEILPENATDKSIEWVVEDESVVEVTNNTVTAKKAGSTVITVLTSNGLMATCTVNVKEKPEVIEPENEEDIYQALFDIHNKVTIDMNISDDELKKMEEDYKAGDQETYRMTDLTITINDNQYSLDEVGVRIKGNTSRVDIFNNNNIDDRNMIHFKLSFKETFDGEEYGEEAKKWEDEETRKARKKRTFATLDGLELKWNRNMDGTYVANTYVNQMYRSFGVYAQNTSLANVRFGGYNYGVYTMYEKVDDIFLGRYFGDDQDDGDLYKCQWGMLNDGSGGNWSGATYQKNTLNSMNRETDGKTYIYELKTNKKKSAQESLKNLINKLNDNSSKETFESVMDADNWIMYAAVAYFVGNPDDLRNNYNNHYIYFDSQSGLAYIFPYDNDRCLGMTTSNKNMSGYSPYASETALQGNQSCPIYNNSVIGRSSNYYTEYTQALKKVAESKWLDYDHYLQYYEAAKANYEDVAVPDSNIKLYVKDLNRTFDNSLLKFSETNGFSSNMTVKDYMGKIVERYETAVNK